MDPQHRRDIGTSRFCRTLLNAGAILLLVSVLYLSSSAPISAHPALQPMPTLRLDYFAGQPNLAITLDPPFAIGAPEATTMLLINANLVHELPSGTIEPDLATWSVSRNRLVYTFTIRKNARFSNGHDVTAADAEFSLERALARSTASPVGLTYLGLIRGAAAFNAGKSKLLPGIKVLTKRTLQITVTNPAIYFLGALSLPENDVLDPTVVAGKPTAATTNYLTHTCSGNQGAGPFMFICRDPSSGIHSFYGPHHPPLYTLVPNPYYYGRKPKLKIELPGLASPVAAYKDYLAGRLETSPIPLVYLSRWRGQNPQYHEHPSSAVSYMIPNTHLAPFNNVHCRQAIAYSIDRETIATNILHGIAHATYAVVPRRMLGYYPGNDNPHYNPAKARAELAQCPSRTTPVELKYPAHDAGYDFDNTYNAIAGMLRRTGLNLKLKRLTTAAWESINSSPFDQTKTQIVGELWFQDYPDAQDYCTVLLRSGAPSNLGGWHNALYDGLVDRADVESDSSKRAQLYIKAQHIALSEGAWISLTNFVTPSLAKPYVHGLVGSESYPLLVPNDLDWASVRIDPH